ncbi:MAG: methylmalonyl-CoA mutase family protein, partial [Chloroflexi bacterium]|nr:methylmalonyl-CoA mutase family protein [Chloroflexota bacterium]
MSDKKRKTGLHEALTQWEKSTLADTLQRAPERQVKFITASSDEVNRLYTPLDLLDFDYLDELGLPGEYPYTRAVHATGQRGRLWTMR